MSSQMTFPGMTSAISSQESAAGLSPFAWLGSTIPEASGPEALHARTTPLLPPSMEDETGSMESVAGSHTAGSISSKRTGRKASSSRTSRASTRGLIRSPAVWDSLATEYANPNDRLRTLVRLIYAGECGLLPTLVARDFRSPGDPAHPRRTATRGQPLPETFSSPVPVELARWMMGFPPAWQECMPTETPSTPGPQPK